MAQFRGTISGQRGEASRLGSKNSGLIVTANGWNAGVTVVAHHEETGDVFDVFATGGSGYSGRRQLIATVRDNDRENLSDFTAMEHIAKIMSGAQWNADTLDTIAAAVRATGREIADSEVDA